MNTGDFQTQLTSIMEIMARTAVAEIGKLFEENSLLLRLEISRCTNENESLKKKCHFLENELKFGKTKRTAPSSRLPGLADTEHQPTIYSVFGKEWCMNLWRHEESNVGQKDDTHLNSSVNTEEPINLLDEEPDVIMINEETLKDDDCSRKNESSSLRGPAVISDKRCVAQSSDDFITYTIPSDDQVQSNVHQTQAEEQPLDGMISTQGDSTTEQTFHSTHDHTSISEEKRFECVFCRRTFNKLTYLKAHMRTHSGEKPYVCTVCGKRFAQKTYLRIHQRTHSGERPYSCMECGKCFAQKSSLNVHLRSHTGEKPYSCSECGKSYAYKQGFNTHQCFS
ncbi:RB-associated KRAB zinc finger protein-like isoform X2 [Sinocyclocheilus anshuiensis]|uniref:RB-associated KRAB zinc finger protein-like isoform X2 n=1 Tax=Sinocyclocheilus anshuiensis TaxID=1608454 RepID=UPI0007B904C5|nr:PREDICTED: RB-associated KRAB zinc finger protein-like isoform X2 [Sinocyclocheilus anshuiensis]